MAEGERPVSAFVRPRSLGSREYRRRTAVLCVFHAFPTFGYYGFGTLVPLVLGVSRLSSALMPFVLVPVLQQRGPMAMFAVVAAAMLIVVVDVAVFAPSTTGLPLEAI